MTFSVRQQLVSSLLDVAISTSLALFSLSASGQNVSENDSTIVYTPDFFAQYAPITAQDMLDRIPGQGQASGQPGGGGGPGRPPGNPSSGGRGLGAGGGNEILVNGKRTAGKSNQTSDLLRRISASQVREIQIIRGTSGDLDVRGSTQVVNIELFEELPSSTIAYQASVNHFQDNENVVTTGLKEVWRNPDTGAMMQTTERFRIAGNSMIVDTFEVRCVRAA